jgi:hypothetical protein
MKSPTIAACARIPDDDPWQQPEKGNLFTNSQGSFFSNCSAFLEAFYSVASTHGVLTSPPSSLSGWQ